MIGCVSHGLGDKTLVAGSAGFDAGRGVDRSRLVGS